MIVAVLLSLSVLVFRVPQLRLRRRPRIESSPADVARLLSIATAAGLPLGTALETVAPNLSGCVGDAVVGVVRTATTRGLAAALLAADELGPLASTLARAHSSGSPLASTLDAYLAAEASRRVTSALEVARTAPVKLMVPLALLLLPGFTALVVGPTLLNHVLEMTRLGT